MPDGRIHLAVNLAATTGVFYAAYQNLPWETLIPFGVGYLFATFFMTPDLDQVLSTPATEMEHLGHWARVPEMMWSAYWEEYAIVQPHRGRSHWPVYGTLFRWVNLLLPYCYVLSNKKCHRRRSLVWKILGLTIPVLLWLGLCYVDVPTQWLLYTFIGCAVSDLVHIVADHTWSLARGKEHI